MAKKEVITAYKGFDENLKCRDFQFEIGKTYIHEGAVKACSSGFHSCTNPWDVLSYYDITSRFAIVEVGGQTETHADDSKIVSAEITVKAELKLSEFISDCVKFLKDSCKPDDTVQSASENFSQLVASRNYSKLLASGYSSQLLASGNYSQLLASGNFSKLVASRDYSQLLASGNYSQLVASGNSSIAIISGTNGRVKGGKNCALALTRWVKEEQRFRITVAYVGENGIKKDTWYKLNDEGLFVEES